MTKSQCAIADCGRPVSTRGWCTMHYHRWRRHGDPGPAGKLRGLPIGPCSVEGCDELKRSSGADFCEMHYCRMRRSGTLEARPKYANDVCIVDGCGASAKSRDMCDMHDSRVRRHGDPNVCISLAERNLPRGELHPGWRGDAASYRAAHQRVRKARGRASQHPCVDCGNGARQWSYDHKDPDERRTPQGYPYSTDLKHYEPRCVPCHKKLDLAQRAPARAEDGAS